MSNQTHLFTAPAPDDGRQTLLEDMADANGWVGGYRVGPASDDPYQVGEGQWSGDFEVSRVKALPVSRLAGAATFTPGARNDRARALASGIQESGVISPIIVDDLGEVLEGQHRLEAAAILGLELIPGVVLTPDLQTRFLDERNIMKHTLRGLTVPEREALQADFETWQKVRRSRLASGDTSGGTPDYTPGGTSGGAASVAQPGSDRQAAGGKIRR